MALYPDIKVMALYANESFENNFGKNCLIRAKLNSLNSLKPGVRRHASYGIINEMVMDAWKHVTMDGHILDGFR